MPEPDRGELLRNSTRLIGLRFLLTFFPRCCLGFDFLICWFFAFSWDLLHDGVSMLEEGVGKWILREKATREKWSGRRDLNSRPHAPQACALPGCATSRPSRPRRTAANLTIPRYHLPSRSVKKLRRESRRSSSILRFNFTASLSATVAAVISSTAASRPPPFSRSRRWRRAPAIVKPSS